MFASLPTRYDDIRHWSWTEFEPYFADLANRELTAASVEAWLTDWSRIQDISGEILSRARVTTTQDTADEEAESRLKHLLATLVPPLEQATNRLNQKLLATGLVPPDMDLPIRKMQTDVAQFREANISLKTREQVLGLEFNKIVGGMKVEWNGEPTTLPQLQKVQQEQDRATRERAWRLMMNRYLQDREAINGIWTKLFEVRQQLAQNVGAENYRSYIWQARHRYDYTPEDCATFHDAIEQVVLPAARRRNQRRRERLGLETLRPWDLSVDPEGRPPLRPWETMDDFTSKAGAILNQVDPVLGGYYRTMRDEQLLDLPNRMNKGVGAYCTGFPLTRRPFVFMNAVNTRDDVRTLLHEIGHAFHGFEVFNLNYNIQRQYPIEFAEVASMAMELLAAPYLTTDQGGYFSPDEAARDRIEHLEKILYFWPYMAVVDSFQHRVYTAGDAAADPAFCDQVWAEQWDRFMVAADYSGLDDVKATGWHRKHHIFRYPFYYVEYGLAQLGAVQVWANALQDQHEAVAAYRRGLALGGTRNLHELFGATGAKFAFDADTLGSAVELIEQTIEGLEMQLA